MGWTSVFFFPGNNGNIESTLHLRWPVNNVCLTSEAINSKPMTWRFFSFLMMTESSWSSSWILSRPVHKLRKLIWRKLVPKVWKKKRRKIKKVFLEENLFITNPAYCRSDDWSAHSGFCQILVSLYSMTLKMWSLSRPWKYGQSHQKLITSYHYPNDVSMQLCSDSTSQFSK